MTRFLYGVFSFIILNPFIKEHRPTYPLAIVICNDVLYGSLLQEKCQQYWPGHINITEKKGPNLYITVTSFVPYAEFQIRNIQLRSVSFSGSLALKNVLTNIHKAAITFELKKFEQIFLYNTLDSYVFFRHQSQEGS